MLQPRFSPNSLVYNADNVWRLQIPATNAKEYRLAQLDNYFHLGRSKFPFQAPHELHLVCRSSSQQIPGTWGFGFWNDPLAFAIGLPGMNQRLPTLPNACWFFNASAENHLSFHDHLNGNGFLAQTFSSAKVPAPLLLPALIATPMLFQKTLSKWMRRSLSAIISEDSQVLDVNTTQWHAYHLDWQHDKVIFRVDGSIVFTTTVSPRGSLGAVIWIDNQYAAWAPDGRIRAGTLAQKTSNWLEIKELEITD